MDLSSVPDLVQRFGVLFPEDRRKRRSVLTVRLPPNSVAPPNFARRRQMPFAAIGFAAVVSMIPGVFLFRMASGLLQLADGSHTTLELLSATIADGLTAGTIIMAMSFGLIVPKLAIDRICERSTQTKS